MTAGRLDPPVTLVLEGRARAGADEAVGDSAEVVRAPGEGDIAAIAEAHREVIVVTAEAMPLGVAASSGKVLAWFRAVFCALLGQDLDVPVRPMHADPLPIPD